jgi:hypothetical protein
MKRNELYKYIKTEIINELSLAEDTALVTSKAGTKSVSFTNPNDLNALKTDSNVSSITTTSGKKIKEAESSEISRKEKGLNEMSPRPRSIIKKGDNFDEALELYDENTIEGQMLKIIDEAGEEGISQEPLAQKLGINATSLNPRINEFISAKALAKPTIKTAPSEEPEDEDFDEEEFIEKDEEETEFTDKGEEETEPKFDEKEADKEASVSAEKEKGEEFDKEEVEKVNKAREILIKKRDKILAADENDDEATYKKEMDLLKIYVKNNKDTIKKGKLTDIISSIINVK